jgi:uncharacterized protein with HEPN domain
MEANHSIRHHPAYEYFDFKPERLWEFVQEVLPGLERKLRKVELAPASPG